MSLLTKIKQFLLGPRPITAEHLPACEDRVGLRADELPPFNLHIAELMRYDPQVRIGLGVRNGMLMQSQVEVAGPDARENDWVAQQWQRIWSTSASELLKAKVYGFVPCEVMYRLENGGLLPGAIGFDRLEARHPRAARPLIRDGRIAGFALRLASGRTVNVVAPKALVATFDCEFGNAYGCPLLERAYPAWYEKWMDGGAKKLLRQRMWKDAYVGDILWYPSDAEIEGPNGQMIPWRVHAQEIVRSRTSGGTMTLPLMLDPGGRKLLDYSPPQATPGVTQMFKWKQDCDTDIWKSLEVPPEVIEAFQRGSGYSGRAIPLMICLAAAQLELAELVACVDRDILRPLVQLNFGRPPQFELRPCSLIECFTEKMRGL